MSVGRRITLTVAGALLSITLARAELADPLAREVAENPALAAIARRDVLTARALAAEAAAILAAHAPGMRSSEAPDETDRALLRQNRLLDAVYRHDPAAALDLLARIKQAGGQR